MNINKYRYKSIDALRGLALILMLQQHFLIWLWEESWISNKLMFQHYPLQVIFNFLANFSAPLFVMLAGVSSHLVLANKKYNYRQISVRGISLIIIGYCMNFVVPDLFFPASWYILQLLGFYILISPLLNKLKNFYLLILIFLSPLASSLAQTILKTPLMLTNQQMSDLNLPGGLFRIIFVEGHFPVIAWLPFFLGGILVCRLYVSQQSKKILLLALTCLGISLTLIILRERGYVFASRGYLFRFFLYLPYVYPLLPPLIFLQLFISLSLFLIASAREEKKRSFPKILISSGQSTLSLFIFHLIIAYNLFKLSSIYKSFSASISTILTIILVIILSYISYLWHQKKLKYGLEHLIKNILKSRLLLDKR